MTPELLAALKSQTVIIDVVSPADNEQVEGSGVIVSRNGFTYTILTVKHLINDAPNYDTIVVKTSDGNTYKATAGKQCGSDDLMAMSFQSKSTFHVAEIATAMPPIGATMDLVANPLAHYWNDTQVTLFGLAVKAEFILGDTCVGPCGVGQSGGGLYDSAGKLLGIAFGNSTDTVPNTLEQIFVNIAVGGASKFVDDHT